MLARFTHGAVNLDCQIPNARTAAARTRMSRSCKRRFHAFSSSAFMSFLTRSDMKNKAVMRMSARSCVTSGLTATTTSSRASSARRRLRLPGPLRRSSPPHFRFIKLLLHHCHLRFVLLDEVLKGLGFGVSEQCHRIYVPPVVSQSQQRSLHPSFCFLVLRTVRLLSVLLEFR